MSKKEINDAIKDSAKKEAKDEKKEGLKDAKPTKEEQMQKEKAELQKRIDELTDTVKRVQAEFENYKKRVDRDREEFVIYAEAKFISKLLPLLDSFELAIKNKDKKDEFIKGIELIYADLHSLLEKEGLKKIEAEKKKFDPCVHEALISEKNGKDDMVIEELQKGYTFRGCVLRTSKVKVSKK